MKARVRDFSLRVVRVVETLPRTRAADVIGRQLLRSGTSVAANYRAACRAKSRADFINKLAIVEEESDESTFWLEMLADAGLVRRQRLDALISESNEITAIIVSSIRSARRAAHLGGSRSNPKSKIQNPK